MSEIKVNKVSPRTNCGTVQLGDSGDTITIPAGATITNSGTASGFGRTGTVDWDTTPKTATFSAVSGDGFFCNTTAGAFTCNLPAGSAGAIVSVADYAGTWQNNALTVSPNGTDKIGGVNADVVLDTQGQSVTFIFVDSTQGWINTMDSTSNERASNFITASGGTETESGNDKIHTFTGPGTFCVSATSPCAANNVVSYLVVAGGGGSGGDLAGGGGGGGFRELKSPVNPYTASPLDGYSTPGNRITVTQTAYPITVGGGGAAGAGPTVQEGCRGNPSIFSSITSTGGGAGMVRPSAQSGPPAPGKGPGGSGGGACYNNGNNGSGNTPPVSPPQGNNGGTAPGSADAGAAGGGGATAAGQAAAGPTSGQGNGGAGATTSITGSPTAYAGGGGGGQWSSGGGGTGGTGGGGAGGSNPGDINGTAGTANTGGGAGGAHAAGPAVGAAGGSGIVIIRYKFQ